MNSAQGRDSAPLFGGLGQREKRSEIELPSEECTHLEEIGLQAHLIDGFG